ncbi:response regulator [Lacibacterium aquatile]|uniref:Response regulator n=1 Tax=Lacibacterium aquatile TaxID=1168082 RepID=A0ABW5DTR3_9PROT
MQLAADAKHLLVVDDDARLRSLLSRFLTESGFRVIAAGDADEAASHLQSLAIDLIVLDVMMPGINGIDFARRLRGQGSTTPILLLTARGEVGDRIAGLEAGADDYLSKPFEPRELLLRINAILKRAVPVLLETSRDEPIRMGEVTFDRQRNLLLREDAPIHLTQAEASLLAALAAKAGEVVTREDLLETGITPGQERTIDVQVTRLRKKIEPDPRLPRYLQTVRGRGYVLQPD